MIIPILLSTAFAPQSLPFLSPVFSSHMMLQRDKPSTFWGWTQPGSKVTVAVGGKSASGVANPEGKWTVRISPPKVGGPYVVEVDGSQHVRLEDVLVGDVWLCGGQSNMEMGINLVQDGPRDAAGATDPNLRLCLVPHQTALQPQKTVAGQWVVCDPNTIAQGGWGGFSAVGFHFGMALRKELGIPIGLIQNCWGGTLAEAWTSQQGLAPLKDFDSWWDRIGAAIRSGPAVPPKKAWENSPDPGLTVGSEWFRLEVDHSSWKRLKITEGFATLGLGNSDGVAWFCKEIVLNENQAAGQGELSLGAIDDEDTTWVNGVKVGGKATWNEMRNYALVDGTLKAGKNLIVVRVLDTGGLAGFSSKPETIFLKLGDGTKLPLVDDWRGKAGIVQSDALTNNVNMASDPNVPTSLSNGMLEPWVPFSIKGAIWYQGESNAYRAFQYRRLLPAMIGDWRRRFGQGDFPFYIVSLANFQQRKTTPGTDEWAELREAQAITANKVKNSGLAVAIDIGDAVDIHPRDKTTVGQRLAKIALAKTYRKNIEYSGPTYWLSSREGNALRVRFEHADGLYAKGGAPGEFAIAGTDRVWHWATATIDADSVILRSPEVPEPIAVRYAWQSNPIANLYNSAGLPAVPFRSDNWPGVSDARK